MLLEMMFSYIDVLGCCWKLCFPMEVCLGTGGSNVFVLEVYLTEAFCLL